MGIPAFTRPARHSMSLRLKLRNWARRKLIKMVMGTSSVSQPRTPTTAANSHGATRMVRTVQDLEPLQGQEIGVSDWLLVDQPMIDAFAELTRDEFWTHTDPERCRNESPYGQTIAHGIMMQAFITYWARQIIDFAGDMPVTVNYGFDRIRYSAPALSGVRYRLRLGLKRLEPSEDRVRMFWDVKIEAENSAKPCLVAEWITITFTSLRVSR
jgi:acyl dehydratase